MMLSELISKMQESLEKNGDSEVVISMFNAEDYHDVVHAFYDKEDELSVINR